MTTENTEVQTPPAEEHKLPIAEVSEEKAAPAEPAEPEEVEYEPTDDPALDLALEFIGKLGIGADHATMIAAQSGNFGPLRDYLGALGDKAKGYERFIKIGEASFARGKAEAENKAKAAADTEAQTKAAMAAAIGGDQNWPQIKAWFEEKAEPSDHKDFQAALKSGGRVAVAYMEKLFSLYRKAGGTFEGASVNTGDKTAAAREKEGKLSPVEYAKAVRMARAAYRGRDWDNSVEYKAIRSRL